MQPHSNPVVPDPSTGTPRKFSRRELAIMRRSSLAQAAQLKVHVRRECAAHTYQRDRRTLNKILDVILLIEEALDIDAVELLQ